MWFVALFTEYHAGSAGSLDSAQSRVERLKDRFSSAFGVEPAVYARSPGRVNLIGEHIDYEGYGVLPMAIELDTVVAIRKNPRREAITLRNVDDSEFPELAFPVSPDQKMDTDNHSWGSYVIAAYKGVFEHLRKCQYVVPDAVGLDVMVDGRVPTGSGLSSSAAIVCSCSLAIMEVLGVPRLKKGEVAEFTALAEQYVGVISGGMDQAISIMGKNGVAQLIEFNPVRASPVSIPDSAAFVVAHSLQVSNKAETSVGHYNLRVVECTIASALLAKKLGSSKEEILDRLKTLKMVEPLIERFYLAKGSSGQDDSNVCVVAVNDHLKAGECTTREIEAELGFKIRELFRDDDAASEQVLNTFDSFKPHARAIHVYSEKQRVYDFAQVCADTRYNSSKTMKSIGLLMDSSHESCDSWYDCSSDELNRLVKTAKECGAIGSRLTGAGWGGCTVSLVPKDSVMDFISRLKKSFYDDNEQVRRLGEEKGKDAAKAFVEEMLFVSQPAQGGCILKV
jgi:N-acetylgalactosamine kinase